MTPALRVATFNAGLHPDWFHHAGERAGLLMTALGTLDADVVALQEVWTDSLRELVLAGPFPHAVAADPLPGGDGPWAAGGNTGVVLLSRLPLLDAEVAVLPSTLVRRAVIVVRLATDPVVTVIATHLTAFLRHAEHPDPGGWPGEHRSQVEMLLEMVAGIDGPAVLAGDLNAGPTAGDFVGELESGYRRLRSGFETNAYLDGLDRGCTWCPDNPLVTVGDHGVIDHVMANGLVPARARRILDVPVALADGTMTPLSDHFGVLVEFGLGGEGVLPAGPLH